MVPPVIEFGLVNRDVDEDEDEDELVLPPPLPPPPPLRLVSCLADSAIALKDSGIVKAWMVATSVRRKRMLCWSFILVVVVMYAITLSV